MTDANLSSRPGEGFAITTRRPVAILMIVLGVCVFGWVSYQRLSLNLMPDISYPTLTVRTEYAGTAPEEIETLVSRPLEQELGILPHLVSISSISKAGLSDIVLEFDWDTDMNSIAQDIREKADRVYLPEGAQKPLLLRYDPSLDPIMRIGLYGRQNLFDLRYLAENEIKRQLEALPGVAAVKVKGGLEEEIQVALNERKIALMGLDIGQINGRLAQANVNLPGGNLREGQVQYLIRTLNEFRSLEEIADLVVANEGGADIRLRDIGSVRRSHKERQVISRVNGRESIEIEVYKEADANIVSVAALVKGRLYGLPAQQEYVEKLKKDKEGEEKKNRAEAGESEAEDENLKEQKRQAAIKTIKHLQMTDFLAYRLPADAQLELLSDQSVFIANSIAEVQSSALLGGAMAILVLFVFLRNILHTIIIGLTIPLSIVATFAPMYIFDVSLNIMSLGGLALGVGMLVDNSIVVLESIFRCREEGDNLIRATIRGTGEVGTAVFASTLTTITVFFPIVFVEGVAGQVFGDMALTVVFSLLASLGVALFFIPMLASRQVGDSDGLLQSHFLQLDALNKVRDSFAADRPWFERLFGALVGVPLLLKEVVWRLVLALVTLVWAACKGIGLVLFEVLWPALKPIEFFWVRPAKTFQSTVNRWGDDTTIAGWRPGLEVWSGILAFAAPGDLARSAAGFWQWMTKGVAWRTGLAALLLPLVVAYLALRFVIQMVFRLVGIALQVSFMVAALLLVTVLVLVAVVMAPLFAPLLFSFDRIFGAIQRAYPALLRRALRLPLGVVAVAVASFSLCWFVLLPRLGTELIPQVYQAEFNLDIALPVGTPLTRTARVVGQLEEVVRAQAEVGRLATRVGSDQSASSAADEGEHTAQMTVTLVPGASAAQEEALVVRLRQLLREIPEVEVEVSHPALFSFKTPVEVEVRGYNLQQLKQLSLGAESTLSQVPGLADVKSSLQAGNPELQIVYKRDRLAEFGLDLRRVAELVRNKIQGQVATDFRQAERQIDILVRLREDDRLGLEELKRLVVIPGGDVAITLAAVADISVSEGPSEIRRIDQQRGSLITANTEGIDLGTASKLIEQALRKMEFPLGFDFVIGGQNREMETSLNSLYFALALAIFLVYIVMASQFESLVHPFIIMFTVPLALIGVVAVLYLLEMPLSIVVFIGLIMLAGIVVNNAIVLVDYINTLRRQGLAKIEAIVRASSVRLRPILMTTTTTVLGLLPMALGLGEGAEIRTPMALTVIAGLISSTLLTLIVIPTVYILVDRGD